MIDHVERTFADDDLLWPSFERCHGEESEQGLWNIVKMKLGIGPFACFFVHLSATNFQVEPSIEVQYDVDRPSFVPGENTYLQSSLFIIDLSVHE
jgi:hypothetical protein